jgi:hypothetical protein
MRLFKPANEVIFADSKIEESFNSLNEEDWLKRAIRRAVSDFKENAFCGERIKKELIPKEYLRKYGINNLLWYPLPNAWRLVYSVSASESGIITAII